jgi:mRNA interferase RelE/StbE
LAYKIEIQRQAVKELDRVGLKDRKRIQSAIDGLAQDPRPAGSKKLRNREGWRIRVGVYRILYKVEEQRLFVLVVRIGHRKDAYR